MTRIRRKAWGYLFGALRALTASATLVGVLSATSANPAVAYAAGSPAGTALSAPLPTIPELDGAVTAGQSARVLLSKAISLSSTGVDDTALRAALAVAQQRLDTAAQRTRSAQLDAAAAATVAVRASIAAASAQTELSNMSSAVRQAAITLYVGGSTSIHVNPGAGALQLYAADYLQSADGPFGVLARRRTAALHVKQLEKAATAAKRDAEDALRAASKALSVEDGEVARLQDELRSLSDRSAAVVASDHEVLAAQVAKEVAPGGGSLQFSPLHPLPAPMPTTSVALTWAFAELGRAYQWGAAGPSSFDCSGLVQFVWRAAGVQIPRVAADQYTWAVPVPLDDLVPGDLVFFGTTDIHHVGIYIGGGLMINAPHAGDVVRVSPIWWSDLAGFGRVHGPGTPVPPHGIPSEAAPAAAAVLTTTGTVPSQSSSTSPSTPTQRNSPGFASPRGEQPTMTSSPTRPAVSPAARSTTSCRAVPWKPAPCRHRG